MQHHRWLFIEVVGELLSEPVADLPPKLDEGLSSFDVDVRFLGQKVCHHADVDLWLPLSLTRGDGMRSELVEVGLQGFKELDPSRRLRAPFGRPLGLPLCPGLNGLRFLSL